MELFNSNNFENPVLRPSHASGRTLDLVLSPGGSGVDNLNVPPISSNISVHGMVFFYVNFPKIYSFTKSIAFKKCQRVADASLFCSIE